MTKRIISILLALTMLVGLFPAAAFAADAEEPALDTGEVSLEGANGFGALLSEDIMAYQEGLEEEALAGYTVTDLVIEGGTATATYDTLEEAILVVALYTEDGMRMLTSGTATAVPEETTAVVALAGELPQYFMASAYLLDRFDASPLCAAYETPMYTQQMQELLASTVDDYDPALVLELDDDKTTNFAVYAEGTKVIEPAEGINTVLEADDEARVYVIGNIDDQFAALQTGEIFAYSYAPGELLIVKVDRIKLDGTTATITGASVEMAEVFSHVKLEAQGDHEDISVDMATADEGVTYHGLVEDPGTRTYGMRAIEGGTSIPKSLSYDLDKSVEVEDGDNKIGVNISGSLILLAKASLNYYISWERQYLECKIDASATFQIDASAEVSLDLPIGTIGMDIKDLVYIGFAPTVHISFSGEASVVAVAKMTVGFCYDHGTGFRSLNTSPQVTCEQELHGTFYVGLSFGPKIQIKGGDLAEASLTADVGVVITGVMNWEEEDDSDAAPDEIHACGSCLKVTFDVVFNVTVFAQLLKSEDLKFSKTLCSFCTEILRLYHSYTYDESGMGDCPHRAYRVTVSVVDRTDSPLAGAQVTAGELQETTNANGVAVLYLPNGSHRIQAAHADLSNARTLEVDGRPAKAEIMLMEGFSYDMPLISFIQNIPPEQVIDITGPISEWNGNRYQVFDVYMTWTEAEAYCRSIGGHLVTITSAQEQAVVESLLVSAEKYEYWIGAYRPDGMETYVWVTGEPFTYSNWAEGQPDKDREGLERYAQIFSQTLDDGSYYFPAYEWNDIMNEISVIDDGYFNESTIGFICEFEADGSGAVAVSAEAEMPKLRAAFGGSYETDEASVKTATFRELMPEGEYVLLVLEALDAAEPLAPENVLYIHQGVADEEGALSFRYLQRMDTEVSYVIACGPSNKDLADAQIWFPEMAASGVPDVVDPEVVYEDTLLIEGIDYVIVGDVDYTVAGDYTCYIRGIRNYTGLVECHYVVGEVCTHRHRDKDGFCTGCGAEEPAGGSGTENDPYTIGNVAQLYWFATQVDAGNRGAHAVLTADIDLGGREWTPIAQTGLYNVTTEYDSPDSGYTGIFDGAGHVISDLTVPGSSDVDTSYGLFGTVSGTVKALGITGFTYRGKEMDARVGAVVGQMLDGALVENCYVLHVDIDTGNGAVGVAGGIAGCNYSGTVRNCFSLDINISAARYGGIVGDNCADGNGADGTDRPGLVVNCYTDWGTICDSSMSGTASGEADVTAERFASGEIAYLLQSGVRGEDVYDAEGNYVETVIPEIWGQNIDNGVTSYDTTPNFYGPKVYKVTHCDGTTEIYSNTNANKTHIPEAYTNNGGDHGYTCQYCDVVTTEGHRYDGTTRMCVCGSEEPVTDPGLTLNYPTLSFEDEIIYNVYFSVKDMTSVVEMGLMVLPKMDQNATIDDAVALVPGYVTNGVVYLAKSEGIPAANMGDTLYFKVYAKLSDGSYAYSTAGGYNAKAYANSILKGENTAEMKALVVSMLNYGAEAQLFFGHNTGSLVNNALTADQQALVKAYDSTMMDAIVKADSSKTTNFVRVNSNFRQLYPSVSFDGAFAINFYCAPAVKVDDGMTLYYWDMETMASVDKLTVENATGSMEMTDTSGMWWGQVAGIAAKEMDDTYYVSCVFESNGETVTTGVIPYSLGKYCSDKAAADGDAQQSFAQATAVYGYYAKNYFASIA